MHRSLTLHLAINTLMVANDYVHTNSAQQTDQLTSDLSVNDVSFTYALTLTLMVLLREARNVKIG